MTSATQRFPEGARRCLIAAVVCAVVVVTVQVVAPRRSITLGPVEAVTPDKVIPNQSITYVFHPTIADRGQSASVHDEEVKEDSFVLLDNATREPMESGLGMAVSGDGCMALWARYSGNPNTSDSVAIGVTDRCRGGERFLFTTSGFYEGLNNELTLSHDGRFGVVLKANLPPGTEFPTYELVRVDTQTGEQRSMPLPGGYFGWLPRQGVDISDDGNLVVVPVVSRLIDVALWNVGDNTVQIVTSAGSGTGGASFPSISGDGRYVSFASSKRFVGPEERVGPWVYVLDRSNGSIRLISGAIDAAFSTSISRDGSQVAFAVAPNGCDWDARFIDRIENACAAGRIDVAFTSVPGFGSGFATETISRDVRGGITGRHFDPKISGNGRWVIWVSDSYNALTGASAKLDGRRNAFIRRRDPRLSVDLIDFGTIPAATNTVRSTTVRNSGTTSVYLDQITLDPGRFTAVGGTCTLGMSMPPGTSCTIDVRYTAPGNTATTDGTILVGETGFDAVTARNTLRGAARAPDPVVTTTVPATTTTIVTTSGTPTTTTLPTIVTIVPTTTLGTIELSAVPNPVEFGGVPVQIPSPSRTITVTNTGTASGVLVTVKGGAHPDDFGVNVNECNTATLAPGESCVMEVVLFARGPGERTATLTVSSGAASVDIPLRGNGTFEPRLMVSPAAVTVRAFTTIVGQGFPPGDAVVVDIGGAKSVTVTPDENGRFQIPFSPFGVVELGSYPVIVPERPLVYTEVRGQLVVVLPTFQPQGPGGPAFGNSLIVTRGS